MTVSYPQTETSKSSDNYIDTTKSSTSGGENVQSFSRKVISRLEQILTWFNGLATVATSGSYNDLINKPTTTAGSSTQPIYFSSGTPTACGTSLAVDITGNAATATTAASCAGNASTSSSSAQWTTARTIILDGVDSGEASIDGSANVTITTTCTGCSATCTHDCGSSCSNTCGSSCSNSCGSSCSNSCGAGCTHNCGGSCTSSCGSSCTSSCGSDCTASCKSSCSILCSGGCSGCGNNCSSGCGDSCSNNCSGRD